LTTGEGLRVWRGRRRSSVASLAHIDLGMAAGSLVALSGYLALFLLLHLRSIGWAPGQVLEPLAQYWGWFYSTIFSEERVMASRRSGLASLHPWLLLGVFATLALSYVYLLRRWRSLPYTRQPGPYAALMLAFLFSLPLVALPNLLSGDVYSNISFGRIGAVLGGNPFIDPPQNYPGDRYTRWVDWKEVPSVYGPGWIYPSMLLTLVVEAIHSSIITYVLAYKLLALALHLLNGLLIARILARWRPVQRNWGTAFYVLNPLALIEFAGNAHNDVLMISFILAGLLLHLQGQWAWTIAAFTLAVLTKWIALPLLPLYGLVLLWTTPGWKQRLRYTSGSLAIFLGLSIGLYLPYWEGPSTFRVLVEAPPQRRMINSFGQLATNEIQYGMYLLGRWPQPELEEWVPVVPRIPRSADTLNGGPLEWREAQRIRLERDNRIMQSERTRLLRQQLKLENVIRYVGLGVLMAAAIAGALVTRDFRAMLLATAWLFFIYVTLAAMWVWPWYITWFVALAALLDWQNTGRTAIILSACAPITYAFFSGLPVPPAPERFRVVFMFGPALLFVVYRLWVVVRSRRLAKAANNGMMRQGIVA
jgi:hypothetical protein